MGQRDLGEGLGVLRGAGGEWRFSSSLSSCCRLDCHGWTAMSWIAFVLEIELEVEIRFEVFAVGDAIYSLPEADERAR